MASVTQLVCDITGRPASATRTFELDGTAYEIDLDPKEVEKFDKAFAFVTGAARRVTAVRAGKPAKGRKRDVWLDGPSDSTPAGDAGRNALIRAWAAKNGLPCSPRGRIAAHIVKAYDEEATAAAQAPTVAPVKAPDFSEPASPEPSTPTPPPAKGRSKKPERKELESVWNQARTPEGVSDHFGVSLPTARKWIKDEQLT